MAYAGPVPPPALRVRRSRGDANRATDATHHDVVPARDLHCGGLDRSAQPSAKTAAILPTRSHEWVAKGSMEVARRRNQAAQLLLLWTLESSNLQNEMFKQDAVNV